MNKKYGLIWEDHPEPIEEQLKTHHLSFEEVVERRLELGKEGSPQHLLIEGDNLEALTSLQTTHKGMVGVIYIDPPYNTKNKFKYSDNYGHHSKWLYFMSKRLNLAKELMSEDGVIFISIDDNEMAQLKLLCDEVFGENNFVSNLIWVNNLKGRQIDKHLANVNEYILCYAKKIEHLKFNKFKELNDDVLSKYSLEDEYSKYAKGVVLYNTNSKFNIETRKNLVYSIYFNPENGSCICKDEKYLENEKWVLPEENLLGQPYIKIIPPIRSTNGKRGCWRWSKEKFEKEYQKDIIIEKDAKGNYMAYTKDRLSDDGAKLMKYKNLITNISSTTGTTELTNIFGDKIFDYPKPKELLKRIINLSSTQNSIILDFFAGSGTTGHAVLELNKEDGGNRQFILCTNNENNICEEVTYERLNKVINGYTTPKGKEVQGISANLKYLKTKLEPKEEIA
jgi:adenine-specific DNA-methyltransferase